jgi:hypothetical protein
MRLKVDATGHRAGVLPTVLCDSLNWIRDMGESRDQNSSQCFALDAITGLEEDKELCGGT